MQTSKHDLFISTIMFSALIYGSLLFILLYTVKRAYKLIVTCQKMKIFIYLIIEIKSQHTDIDEKILK